MKDKNDIEAIGAQIPEKAAGSDLNEKLEMDFEGVKAKIMLQPNFYYIEERDGFVLVKKRVDDSRIFMTREPYEMAVLIALGLKKEPDISEPMGKVFLDTDDGFDKES